MVSNCSGCGGRVGLSTAMVDGVNFFLIFLSCVDTTNWLVVCIDQYCHCCSNYKAFYVLGVILRLKFA